MQLTVEFDRETDGRHIAQVPELPGCLAYGETREEADARARGLALHILADRVEHGERDAQDIASAAAALGIPGVEGMDPESVFWATDADLWEQIKRSREDPRRVSHDDVLRRFG
jgi:predicted RNase H-like HicB family nuclease